MSSYRTRPYQDECLARVLECLAQHDSTLVEMATGLGKTVLFTHLAAGWPRGRVLVLVHREELAAQAAEKIEVVLGEAPGIEMGEDRVDEDLAFGRPKVVVASVQTLSRPNRRRKFKPAEFGLGIIDEAHHAVAMSYQGVVDYFRRGDQDAGIAGNPDWKLLGVTATAKRADDFAMGQVFRSVAYRYGIEPAIEDGWLVPVRQQVVTVEGLSFDKVRTVAGDFNEADLERLLNEEGPLYRMAAPTVEAAGDRPCLVFCVTVAHAKALCDVINSIKKRSALFLSGETAKDDRRRAVQQYKAGDVQFLCNCGLFLEGFDAPATAVVSMCRPTKSHVLYVQVLGRGTRPLPGVVDGADTPDGRRTAIAASAKPYMTCLDFVGNTGRNAGAVRCADILGGKWGAPVRDYAKATQEQEGGPVDLYASLDRADAELALLDEEEQRRRLREAVRARVQYRTQEVSPFGGGAAATDADLGRRGDATEKQVRYLCHLGVPEATARSYSKRQAGAVIDSILARRGKAS